ncbi:MAG: tetratricopeptide repeat protein [Phycisphaerae bacterium]|jgi:tetratricopeptide (TPR) repeat protein|nr:tetratricopeptide repeat protein [Phycisphaerae bacterium]
MSLPVTEPQVSPSCATFWVRNGAWLAAALGALCYVNTLGGGFVYDDLAVVYDNPRIRSLTDPDIWRRDWWQPASPDQEVLRRHRDRLYRPLTLWTMAANYAVGDLRPFGYHLANVALHVAACVLVWRLGQRLFGDPAVATVGALLFAVHPVHAEAVAGIVGRAEILAALFMLLGLLALVPAIRAPSAIRARSAIRAPSAIRARSASEGNSLAPGLTWKRVLLAATAFLAALFSKETAICYLPVALLVMHATRQRWPAARPRAWWALVTGVLAVPLLIYLAARWYALDGHLMREFAPGPLENPLAWVGLPQRWLHAFTVVGHYVRLMLVPGRLSCDYGLAVVDAERGPELLTFVGILAAAVTIWALCGYFRTSTLRRQLALLSAIFVASYALLSNTVILIGVAVGERLMYWPSIAVLLALALVLVHLWRRCSGWQAISPGIRRMLPYLGAALFVALGARTVVRNADWSSNLELFARDAASFPESAKLHIAVAREILQELERTPERRPQEPDLQIVRAHLRKALAIYPRSATSLELLGRERALAGDRQGAISYFEAATQLQPLAGFSQEILAKLRDECGAAEAALAELGRQTTTRPADADLRRDYGVALLRAGRYQEALPELQEAVRLNPQDGAALASLGEAYAVMDQRDKAIEALQAAAQRTPGEWQIHANLAKLLAEEGDKAAALRHAEQAARLAPDQLEARLNLAEALALNERRAEALALLRQTRKDMPPDNRLRPAIDARIRDLQRSLP